MRFGRRAVEALPYAAFVCAGVWCAFYPTLLSGFRQMEINTGDTRLQNYFLEYGYRWAKSWLTLHPVSFWDQPFFFPARNVGAYSDVLLGAAPIYWLIRTFQFETDTSFQLWMIVVLLIDFACMALFLRNCLGFGRVASAAGAFLFAFGSPRLAQLGHQQLLPQFFTILAFYGLFRLFEPRKITREQGIWMLFLCFAAQLWAGFYLGWLLFLGLLVPAIWVLILRRHRGSAAQTVWPNRKSILAAGSICVVLIAPMAYHYLKAVREVGPRPFRDIEVMIPPLQSWLYMGAESWLYSWETKLEAFRSITYEHEQHLGIGWVTLVLAVVGFQSLARKRRGWVAVVGFSALTLIVLTTHYPGGFIPWRYVYRLIPGGVAIRAVSRIGLLLLIPLSIGLGHFIETRRSVWIAMAIGVICVLEQVQHVYAYDKFRLRRDVAAIAAQADQTCPAFFYSPAYVDPARETPPQYELHITAMWAGLEAGVPTINGYSGNFPRGWWDLWDNKIFDESARIRLRNALRTWSLSHGLDPQRVCWIQSP